MALKPFRKYECKVDWINEKTGRLECTITTINLFNVEEWTTVDNSAFGIEDNIERCMVVFSNDQAYKLRVSYKEFTNMMDAFLKETRLLDDRSMHFKNNKPADPPPVPPMMLTYKGPIDVKFSIGRMNMACGFFPKGFHAKSFEDAMKNSLFSSMTTFN